jgi:hypothetical protein
MDKKFKTFSIVTYYRSIELDLICVTTSKKKFAEITDISLSCINNYAYSYDLRYPLCNENPDKLFAKPGLGGQAKEILGNNDIKPYEECIKMINNYKNK